jgi:acetyl-CoA carboxylase biotin carboxyl carrier protein
MPIKKRITKKDVPATGWDLKDIRELLDVLAKRDITEFEWKKGGMKVRIRRGDAPSLMHVHLPEGPEALKTGGKQQGEFLESLPPSTQSTIGSLPSVTTAGEASAPESKEDLFVIKSPIVGTFFASPAPNAPPFVKQGDNVQVGQVLCIIEAMKLMNEIESEVAGEIIRIYAENGQPVEYGQSLFAIRPSHKK